MAGVSCNNPSINEDSYGVDKFYSGSSIGLMQAFLLSEFLREYNIIVPSFKSFIDREMSSQSEESKSIKTSFHAGFKLIEY